MIFESHILTDAVINSKHIEPRQFLEDASEIVVCEMCCRSMTLSR